MSVTLPSLPFAYNALEPHIDAKTMEIHHTKHHQAYIDKLQAALASTPKHADLPIEELLKNLATLPESVRTAVRNNGGGHYNHSLFWNMLSSQPTQPSEALLQAITTSFGSFDAFKEQFATAALGRFGSGWVWLVADTQGALAIVSSPNQDNPIMEHPSAIVLLGLDVWEHAYYLHYQNKRADYVAAFWNVVNWDYCNTVFTESQKTAIL